MRKNDAKLYPLFNFCSRGRDLNDYTITLARPQADAAPQAARFAAQLSRWLHGQGDDFKGNATAPEAASAKGQPQVRLRATEEAMVRIERQFAGDILKVDPPAKHIRGAIYPPKVDPWDISKW